MEVLDFSHLNYILQAPSKDVVFKLCHEAYLQRHEKKKPKSSLDFASQNLSTTDPQSQDVLTDLGILIKNALFQNSTNAGDILQLFPDDFHKNLRDLLTKVLIENIPNWRQSAMENLVSLPKLVDFNWRVDVKSSSDKVPRMSLPTCILQMKVEDVQQQKDTPNECSVINVELSKETLDTMLDGLGKIRDQLSSVTVNKT